METSYGIEAARPRLGDIAEHVRDTGEVVELTRHGRTIAVIGPAGSVTPHKGVEATLHFPVGRTWTGYLPGVPPIGHTVRRTSELGDETWIASDVESHLTDDGARLVVHLQPGDDHTKHLVEQWECERPARRAQK
ncbi:type II toxin-antitoxin system prevent-host-death family antitoxin [Streptomyces sp. MMBL 11-3]|uniref:type II toxin-antitoxin system prevent-host-death family antitoxin n=1 Tax=Streptomyces sp. MMBL 11-3 TaxID=3382639 RepID=UPI0039B533E7